MECVTQGAVVLEKPNPIGNKAENGEYPKKMQEGEEPVFVLRSVPYMEIKRHTYTDE
jgi:hypothetical protein